MINISGEIINASFTGDLLKQQCGMMHCREGQMAADNARNPNADDAAPAESGGNLLVNSAIIAVICGAAAFGVVFFLAPSGATESAACAVSPDAYGPAPLANADTGYVELEDMLITVGIGGNARYVKVNAVVMTPAAEVEAVQAASPMLQDAFLTYLRAIDISDFEAEAFYPDLKEQLSRRAELVLGAERARGVLITEFMLR